MGPISQALTFLGELPGGLLYGVLAVGALLENLVPPIPADTFVVVGGLLVSRGAADPLWVLLGIWVANVSGAFVVYLTGYRYGRAFFDVGAGRRVLTPSQLERISAFYARRGVWAIFFARFLPGFRAVVPAFAGVSHLPMRLVALPIALASAIWYGILLWLGVLAGRNLERAEEWFAGLNLSLLAFAAVVAILVGIWWVRSRKGAPGGRA
jgi:membrane protein DedA with SNARE-associated domain